MLLEAFGNAKTLRNINSSRYGICTRLIFDASTGSFTRLVLDTFLLDASRCVRQPRSERSFHVLYQLCAGALPSVTRSEIHQGSADAFSCLSGSGTIYAEGIDDRQAFLDTVSAFDAIGVSEASRVGFWRLLAAVLHLSNLRFVETRGAAILDSSSESALKCASDLLGVKSESLQACLLRQATSRQATAARDALISCLYSRAFAALVALCNAATMGISVRGDSQRTAGSGAKSADTASAVVTAIRAGQQPGTTGTSAIEVYDLLGAENLALNGYHTLCANYGDVSHPLVCVGVALPKRRLFSPGAFTCCSGGAIDARSTSRVARRGC